jgi:hypothetical protein
MHAFMIERDLPGVGAMSPEDLSGAAGASNAALAELAPRVQWRESWLAQDRTFCIYLAEDEAAIRDHARLSGFPATRIVRLTGRIDPTTAGG